MEQDLDAAISLAPGGVVASVREGVWCHGIVGAAPRDMKGGDPNAPILEQPSFHVLRPAIRQVEVVLRCPDGVGVTSDLQAMRLRVCDQHCKLGQAAQRIPSQAIPVLCGILAAPRPDIHLSDCSVLASHLFCPAKPILTSSMA